MKLLEAAPGTKYKAALGVASGARLRVSEVAPLKVDDIDSTRMLIRIEQGKGRKDRNDILSSRLLEPLPMWRREGKRRNVMLPMGFPGRSYLPPFIRPTAGSRMNPPGASGPSAFLSMRPDIGRSLNGHAICYASVARNDIPARSGA